MLFASLAAGLGGVLIAACAAGPGAERRQQEPGFQGAVVADDPRAALAGRQVLLRGGTAADAAVATYFAMAVALPSAAGLGGGGSCLVHDPGTGKNETLVFVPLEYADAAGRPGFVRGRPRGVVPGNPRGMFALHAAYGGRVSWGALLGPAIAMARDGHPASRALVRQLAKAPANSQNDPVFARIFWPGGQPLREGQRLVQIELAAALSQIGTQEPGVLYSGALGRQFVESVVGAGMALTMEDMRGFRAVVMEPLRIQFRDNQILFAPPPADGAAIAAAQWALIQDRGRYGQTGDLLAAKHLMAESELLALGALQSWVRTGAGEAELLSASLIGNIGNVFDPERHVTPSAGLSRTALGVDHGSAGLVVAHRDGSAVSCSFSMNAPFGTGRIATGTGIFLAAPMADVHSLASASGVAMLVNPDNHELYYAAAAGGGMAGVAALNQVTAYLLEDGFSLEDALDMPRVHTIFGSRDAMAYEPELDPQVVQGLRARGHDVVPASPLGIVSAIYCFEGLPGAERCEIAADKRGDGVAISLGGR